MSDKKTESELFEERVKRWSPFVVHGCGVGAVLLTVLYGFLMLNYPAELKTASSVGLALGIVGSICGLLVYFWKTARLTGLNAVWRVVLTVVAALLAGRVGLLLWPF